MRSRGTIFKKYRVFTIVSGTLYWEGSYSKKGNALRSIAKGGSSFQVLFEYNEQRFLSQVFVKHGDGVREATEFESRVLQNLPVNYTVKG